MKSNICFSDSSFCLPTTSVVTFWPVQLSQHETRRNWKITNCHLQPICQDINPGVFISVGSWLHPQIHPVLQQTTHSGVLIPRYDFTGFLPYMFAGCLVLMFMGLAISISAARGAAGQATMDLDDGTFWNLNILHCLNSTRQPRKSLEIPLFQAG